MRYEQFAERTYIGVYLIHNSRLGIARRLLRSTHELWPIKSWRATALEKPSTLKRHDSPLDCTPQASGSGARYGFHKL
ncbi:MAG TPA: hypothetical protein VE421_13235 [Burkholderiaceae bacterium]|nr:hypothetical protein [Burkholderiaceae bacterium]